MVKVLGNLAKKGADKEKFTMIIIIINSYMYMIVIIQVTMMTQYLLMMVVIHIEAGDLFGGEANWGLISG